jgi:hypothetical protein
MNQVSLRMKEISDIYSHLYEISENSSDVNITIIIKNPTVRDTYRMLNRLMLDWGDSFKKQSVLIDLELKEYFKFIKNEFINLKEVNPNHFIYLLS